MGRRPSVRIILLAIGGLVLLGLMVWYLGFQARFLISGPLVSLSHTYPATVVESAVLIEGQAHNTDTLRLNGRTIFTDEEGYFKELLVLENGYTIMTLEGEDRFGRRAELEQSFVKQSNL